MVRCYVCHREIGFLGWANHVKMEKRLFGEDIFKHLKEMRKRANAKVNLIRYDGQLRLAI